MLQDELAHSLANADRIIVANVFKAEAIPEVERLDLNRVIATIQHAGKTARIAADADAIVDILAREARPKDVIGIFSNGAFGGIYDKLPARFQTIAKESPAEAQL